MSFDSCGYRVLSSITGPTNFDIKLITEYARQEMKKECDIYITFDNDDAGQKFFIKLAKQLISKKLYNFKRLNLPADYKDISDFYAADGPLDKLIETATDGVSAYVDCFMPCENETDAQADKRRADFTEFVMNYGRFTGKAELTAIIEKVAEREYFSNAFLKALLKDATRPPLDDDIVQEILKEQNIIYKGKRGFYIYNELDGIWEYTDDEFIGGMIGEKLGRIYNSGSKIHSVFTVLKTKTPVKEDFDKKPLFVFQNGTLEFETDNFRKHDKTDMATIALPYAYDPIAQCPKFENFLEQIFWRADKKTQDVDGEKRIKLMQEFAGYLLYTDCPFQQSLLLLGEGQNGKSSLLNLIKAVFDEKNFASVDIDKLNKSFQAVQLIGKLGNITTEAGLNFGGAEDTFKKLVAGEEVSDSFKNKDNFTFKTRAKFFIAANALPRAKDTSYGFNRRFIMLNFQNKFVDDHEPIPAKLERQGIANIDIALKAELPGIFNWIYAGYKRLKKNGHFTTSPDNKELMNEFIKNNNPVDLFVEEGLFNKYGGYHKRSEIYELYKTWSSNNGYAVLNSGNFFKKFRESLKRRDIEFDDKYQDHEGKRYFNFIKPDFID